MQARELAKNLLPLGRIAQSHDRVGIVIALFFLNEVDSNPAPFRLVGQISDRQVAQGELLEVTF
jgi:hypothetical protein